MEDIGYGVRLIYSDNHYAVVDKPAGVLSQGDETGDVSVVDVVAAWRKRDKGKPGAAWVGLVHRLDRPVRGLLIVALTSKAAERLSEQVRDRQLIKVYRAMVVGRPKAERLEGIVDGKAAALTVTPVGRAGLDAPSGRPWWRVGVELETGRKHQIRIQLADAGHPIVGDVRYGGPPWHDPRAIALEAAQLWFLHPTRHELVEYSLPDAPAWWATPAREPSSSRRP